MNKTYIFNYTPHKDVLSDYSVFIEDDRSCELKTIVMIIYGMGGEEFPESVQIKSHFKVSEDGLGIDVDYSYISVLIKMGVELVEDEDIKNKFIESKLKKYHEIAKKQALEYVDKEIYKIVDKLDKEIIFTPSCRQKLVKINEDLKS